jgi:hypothetical protein
MPNRIRGEVELVAGGQSYRLLLTLGALAEIEDGLGLSNLSEIAQRMRSMRAGDLAVIAAALLRGGGHAMTPAETMALPCDLATLVGAVTEAFGPARERGSEGDAGRPFAGTTSSRSD